MKRKCRRLNVKNFSHLICQNFKIEEEKSMIRDDGSDD